MVKLSLVASLGLLILGSTFGEGLVLWGDSDGQLWKWSDGVKTDLPLEGRDFHWGGLTDQGFWAWQSLEDRIQIVDGLMSDDGTVTVKSAGLAFPSADLIAHQGDWSAAVRQHDGDVCQIEIMHPGVAATSWAWNDGRRVYALGFAVDGTWIAVGRTSDGAPWVCEQGTDFPAPEGWRGRLTAIWWTDQGPEAAGWGAPGSGIPRLLLWTPKGWSQPDVPEDSLGEGTFPLVAMVGKDGLLLGGWKADAGTGVLRPWFWSAQGETVGTASGDGEPIAIIADGPSLVVRLQSEPWYVELGSSEPMSLAGFGPRDRVVSVGTEKQ